ncbi:MAG: HesB/IscA family protein [Gammaproteobacteria bacterium]
MITITPRAAEQIRKSVEQTQSQGLNLRIAVRREDDGSFDYGLGFDERKDGDTHFVSQDIGIVVSEGNKDFLLGAVLDFVEINPGDNRFIVINPNDPAHKPPARES